VCGIAGLFHYGSPAFTGVGGPSRLGNIEVMVGGRRVGEATADPDDLRSLIRMSEVMLSRGPDSAGLWQDESGAALFAQRRLAIIETSDRGFQPMVHDGGRLVVNFNGEIYNYRALKAELEAKGRRFASNSDTEVLLHLYDVEGPDMVERLRGMFAFALWDRDRRAMLLARDPFGIKPLYVADDGKTLRFASQVKALIAGGGVDTAPQPAAEVGFLLWGSVPEPFTLHRGIRALPAGHMRLWKMDEAPVSRRYHAIAKVLAEAEAGPAAPTGAARVEFLRERIVDTMRHHVVADVPVGVFLSGGLDSLLVAEFATPENAQPLRTVTLGFDAYRGGALDETPIAEATARAHGAEHQTVWVNRAEFAAARDHLLRAMDQPTIDGTNVYFVSKATASTGLKVALSGIGGDEVFAGYPSFRQIPKMVGLTSPFAALGRGFRVVSEPILRHFTSPKYAGLFEYGSSYGGAYLLRRGLFMPWELPDLLDGDIVRQGLADLRTETTLASAIEGVRSPNARVAALELSFYMRNQLLRDADWAGMAHSLEIRTPFVDADFFRTLAPLIAAPAPVTKAELPALLSPSVARSLAGRGKRGFVVPVRDWLGVPSRAGAKLRGWRAWALDVIDTFRGGAYPAPTAG